MSILVNL